MLAPLVTNRKGFYADLAKWALQKAVSHLRVDGEYLPTKGWPRLDRFREHTIELPVGEVEVKPENEKQLRHAVEPGWVAAQPQLLRDVLLGSGGAAERSRCTRPPRQAPRLLPSTNDDA